MAHRDVQKIANDMKDRCSTGQPFTLETLEPQDLYNFTLAATLYKYPKKPIKLRPYQLPPAWCTIGSVVKGLGKEIVAEFSRQSGKTTTMPGATLHFLTALPNMFEPFDKGFNAGIFGPKDRQATYAFDMYKWFYNTKFMHDYLGIKHHKFNSQEISLNNGVRIFCETASPNATIESLTLDLAFCEEAQKITDTRLLSSIYPMCAATNGTRVLTGNPTEERIGHFFKVVSRLGPDVFIVDYKEVIPYSKKYATYVEKMKIELGEFSDEFQTQYALNWVQIGANFCTIEELTELRSGKMIYEMDSPVVVGCDPARINDSTVLTIMSMIGRPHVCMWAEWKGDDWKTQATDITAILQSFPQIHAFNIDTLHGEGISDYLPKSVPVQRVPMEKHIQSWMWKQLRKAIKNQMFTYPEDEQPERYRFEDQVTSLLAKYVGNLYKVEGPSGRNKHDDYGDSLALTWLSFAGRPEIDPDAGQLEPIVPRRKSRRPSAGRRPKGLGRRPTQDW